MADFRQTISEFSESVKVQWNEFKNLDVTALQLPRNLQKCDQLLPRLIDFGNVDGCYEFCDLIINTLNKMPSAQKSVNLCKVYRAHIEVSQSKNLDQNRIFFTELKKSTDVFLKSHACSALGLLSIYNNEMDQALKLFRDAEAGFRNEKNIVDALKTQVRQVMVLQLQDKTNAALAICQKIKKESEKVGVTAISPLLFSFSTLGSIAREQGHRADALDYFKEGVKFSKAMPASVNSAFAMMQYGILLAEMERFEDAFPLLFEAEKIQEILDPQARVCSLLNLLRCFRKLRDWNSCYLVSKMGMSRLLIQAETEDLGNFLEQLILFHLEVFDWSGAENVIAFAKKHNLASESESHDEAVSFLVDEWNETKNEWFEIPAILPIEKSSRAQEKEVLENIPEFIFIDFNDGRIFSRSVNSYCHEEFFAPGTLISQLIAFFYESRSEGMEFVSADEVVRVMQEDFGNQEPPAELSELIIACLDPLIKAHFICEVQSLEEKKWGFVPQATLHALQGE